jgi:hypothetical protein
MGALCVELFCLSFRGRDLTMDVQMDGPGGMWAKGLKHDTLVRSVGAADHAVPLI